MTSDLHIFKVAGHLRSASSVPACASGHGPSSDTVAEVQAQAPAQIQVQAQVHRSRGNITGQLFDFLAIHRSDVEEAKTEAMSTILPGARIKAIFNAKGLDQSQAYILVGSEAAKPLLDKRYYAKGIGAEPLLMERLDVSTQALPVRVGIWAYIHPVLSDCYWPEDTRVLEPSQIVIVSTIAGLGPDSPTTVTTYCEYTR